MAYLCIHIQYQICLDNTMNVLGRDGSKLVNLRTGQFPAYHSLRLIYNQGVETTLKGQSEPFIFES